MKILQYTVKTDQTDFKNLEEWIESECAELESDDPCQNRLDYFKNKVVLRAQEIRFMDGDVMVAISGDYSEDEREALREHLTEIIEYLREGENPGKWYAGPDPSDSQFFGHTGMEEDGLYPTSAYLHWTQKDTESNELVEYLVDKFEEAPEELGGKVCIILHHE